MAMKLKERRVREDGFVEVPPVTKDGSGQIFIPHNELHPEVKEKVAALLGQRGKRTSYTFGLGLFLLGQLMQLGLY